RLARGVMVILLRVVGFGCDPRTVRTFRNERRDVGQGMRVRRVGLHKQRRRWEKGSRKNAPAYHDTRPLVRGATPMYTAAGSLLALALAADPDPQASKYFKITVVDEDTGRGVPLVELRTVNNITLYTDSNGVAAFHEPGLMDQTVFFHVKSHGYEYPKD